MILSISSDDTTFSLIPPLELNVEPGTTSPILVPYKVQDLLAEILQRQSNPLDTRKLPENVTITVGETTTVTNNFNCVKKYSEDRKCKKYCKKCHYEH